MPVFLEEFVESGTIDNRERGKITGHLVIKGIEQPVPIDLVGNAQPDLAGCVITFQNEAARNIEIDLRDYCSEAFIGEAGRMTGSHKGLVYLPTKDPNMVDMIDDFGVDQYANLNFMFLEWFRSGFQHFQLRGIDYVTEISLPGWSIDESELVEQMDRAQKLTEIYDDFMREMYEEERVVSRLDRWDEKIDLIRPLLQTAQSDDERFYLIRKLVCNEYEYAALVVREFSDHPDQYDEAGDDLPDGFEEGGCPF